MRLEDLLERQRDNHIEGIKHRNIFINYAELYQRSLTVSKMLNKIIPFKSLNIAIFYPNSINYVIAYFAIQFINKVVVPLDVHAKKPEIYAEILFCEIDLILTDSKNMDCLVELLKDYSHKIIVFNIDTNSYCIVNSFKSYINKTDNMQNGDENDVAVMLSTSGTTSIPKRVMLTHRNIISNVESKIVSLGLTQNDKVLISIPMFTASCNSTQLLTHIYLGSSIVIMDLFFPKEFFKIVAKEKITNYTCVPSILIMILEYPYAPKYDYTSLKYILFSGSTISKEVYLKLVQKFPEIQFVNCYGQTECTARVTQLLSPNILKKINSVGNCVPGVSLYIAGENGEKLPPFTNGEVMVKGPGVMKGYYKRPTETKKIIMNGWVKTGDIGYMDEEGFLYLLGRIRNMIISGGKKIFPEEIERTLLKCDDVKEAYVYAQKHKILGEIPVAKVVLKNCKGNTNLKLFCKKYLANYKITHEIKIVNYIPKNLNNKIIRYIHTDCG